MKKGLVLILVVLLAFSIAGCKPEAKTGEIKVALIVSSAGANDNGYNQFAIAGLDKAKADFDVTTHVVTTAEDVPGSLELLAEEGYDLIFSLEYNFHALIVDDGSGKSIAEKFPDTTFVIFNAFANTDETGNKIHQNVIEVLFNVNESSFLAGALSVLVNEANDVLFTDSAYQFTPTSADRAVGFVGGSQSPGIQVFSFGYVQGVNHVAKELGVTYRLYETYSTGFGASAANYNIIKSYYDNGANVIFAAAGGVSTNLKNAAVSTGKLAIDVDADQDASQPGSVLTSVLKNTNVSVYDIIEQYVDNTIKAGEHVFYDLNSGATGITELTVIEEHISDSAEAQAKWAEIKAKIADLHTKVANGTIKVVDAQAGEVLDYSTLTNVLKAN